MARSRSDETSEPSTGVIRRITRDEEASSAPTPRGDYDILTDLDEGGLGRIFEARQNALGREVVLKAIRSGMEANHSRRFKAEAAVTAQLEHPNIIPVYDAGRDEGYGFFFAMKRVEGRTWREEIGRLDLARNIDILLKVCDAIGYAHQRGVVHRDLKPDNVMIGSFGEVVVMDWGLALPVCGNRRFSGLIDAPDDGKATGTPIYMAPEMAIPRVGEIGEATDIYLLGAILFELLVGKAPHDFGELEDDLAAAAENRIVPYDGEDEYVKVALQAMAKRPTDRYPSVGAFQEALTGIHHHRDSIRLARNAADRLQSALVDKDYERFVEVIFAYKQALDLWPGNANAADMLETARLCFAKAAMDNDNLDLARKQLDAMRDPPGTMRNMLEERRTLREKQRTALRRLEEVEARHLHGQAREWQLAEEVDFDELRNWEFSDCEHGVEGGYLWMAGGEPQVALLDRRLIGDLRITFQAMVDDDFLCDISCCLFAPEGLPPETAVDRGYQIKYGAYGNSLDLLIRAGTRLWSQQDRPLERDRWFAIEVERLSGTLAFKVDGRVVFVEEDPQPISGPTHCRFGLIGWRARTRYRNLRLYRPSVPRFEDLLDVARRHVQLGHYRTAMHLYEDVLASDSDDEAMRRAEEGAVHARFLDALEDRLPLIERKLVAAWPEARIQLSGNGLQLDVAERGIADLAPVGGIPLAWLDCSDNRIEDLGPLRGMPLAQLVCSGNRIADCAPLQGAPLRRLEADDNRIVDLGPLAGCPLRQMNLGSNPLEDLAGLPVAELVQLYIRGCLIADLAPLAGSKVSLLIAEDNRIVDLAPLRGLPLTHLQLGYNRIVDLAPLADSPLKDVGLCGNPLRELSPLRGKQIDRLDLLRTGVESIQGIETLPLSELLLDCSRLSDLSPLHGMRFSRLIVEGCSDAQKAEIEAEVHARNLRWDEPGA